MERASLPHLESPPRTVGPGLTIRLLLGGWVPQFGWAFVFFGMIFVWLFDGVGGVIEARQFAGEKVNMPGEVTASRETSFTVNSRRVYEISYNFSLPSGVRTQGVSYASGVDLPVGEQVRVEFVAGNPRLSRIVGMRTTPGGLAVLMTFILPFIGLSFALAGSFKGFRLRRLLTIGKLARGTLVSKQATMVQVNNKRVYRMTFAFEAEGGGSFEAVARSHLPEGLEDEPGELVIYDPAEPTRSAMLDQSTYQPRPNDRGVLEASLPGRPAALLLLLPGLSVLITIRYLTTLL